MIRKPYILALSMALLLSCTTDSYLGGDKEHGRVLTRQEANARAVAFAGYGSNPAAATRSANGADAAALLGERFRVYATIQQEGATSVFMDNYQVAWLNGATGSEASTYQWDYVGLNSLGQVPSVQGIKYWNYSADRYDFVAFSGLADTLQLKGTDENTFEVNAALMSDLYIANRVSAKSEHQLSVPGESPEFIAYGSPVKLVFRRATARMRVGFYETIPGYAVKDLRFYYGDNAEADEATSTKTEAGLQGCYPESGIYTVTYDWDNAVKTAYSSTGDTADHRVMGRLAYTTAVSQDSVLSFITADGQLSATGDSAFLGSTAANLTFAYANETIDGQTVSTCWHPVLPYESNETALSLRVDYTLVSLDGSGETIRVRDAKATVPVHLGRWKPNYAYSYVFKITAASGYTGATTDPAGLYPITFDAKVSSAVDGLVHETTL